MAENAKTQDPAKDHQKSTEQRIADLELALAQTRAGLPGGTLPTHSAGPGDEIAETWSAAEQEAEWAADNAGA